MNAGKKPKYIPPDSLTDDDIERLEAVRHQVWRGGAQGLLVGLTSGYLGAKLSQSIIRTNYRSTSAVKYLDRRYTLLSTLLLGAIGSFSGATIFGKRSVILIADVFTRGAKEQTITDYQQKTADAGGGARAQQQRLEQAMRESHGRRMAALQEHKRKKDAGLISTNEQQPDDTRYEY